MCFSCSLKFKFLPTYYAAWFGVLLLIILFLYVISFLSLWFGGFACVNICWLQQGLQNLLFYVIVLYLLSDNVE